MFDLEFEMGFQQISFYEKSQRMVLLYLEDHFKRTIWKFRWRLTHFVLLDGKIPIIGTTKQPRGVK